MENNKFVIYDDEGFEKEMQILFTFETDADLKYVIFHEVNDDSEYFVSRYTDDGELISELNDEEYEMCNEMLNTFFDQIEAKDEKLN